jgi:twinkle protein
MNLVKDYNMKASFFSPEHHPHALHKTTMIEKAIGLSFWKEYEGYPRMSKIDIARYAEWANEKIYLTGAEQGLMPDWDWLMEKFKEQLFSYGIDIFVIDAFNKLSFSGKGNKLDLINDVLTKLTMFAQINNVIIFLIAHPTKMRKEEGGLYASPTLYDVAGSSDFRNQTHDGFSVYRYFGDEFTEPKTVFENLKTKMKFQGKIGEQIEFDYHTPSGRYFELGSFYEGFSLCDKEPEQSEFEEEKELPKMSATDAFGDTYNNESEILF